LHSADTSSASPKGSGRPRTTPKQPRGGEAIFLEEGSTKEGFARFFAKDPDVLMKESEAVFERTLAEFADVPPQ